MNELARRPHTLVPPPLVYATGLGIGWWLQHHLLALGFQVPAGVQKTAWVLLLLSIAVMLWAVVTVWRHKTTVNPYKGAANLVTQGPFGYSRNPIYVADGLLYIAVTLLMGSLWPIMFAPGVWVIIRYAVVAHEEAHLQAKFGAAYRAYCERVRRWL